MELWSFRGMGERGYSPHSETRQNVYPSLPGEAQSPTIISKEMGGGGGSFKMNALFQRGREQSSRGAQASMQDCHIPRGLEAAARLRWGYGGLGQT